MKNFLFLLVRVFFLWAITLHLFWQQTSTMKTNTVCSSVTSSPVGQTAAQHNSQEDNNNPLCHFIYLTHFYLKYKIFRLLDLI